MLTSRSILPLLAGPLLLTLGAGSLWSAFPTLSLKPVCKDQLHSVTTITNAGDGSGRLFLTEQHGLVRIFQNGMLLPAPFLNLTSKVIPLSSSYDERGLLGLAFHPDYESSEQPGYRKFYVFYNAVSDIPAGTDPVLFTTDPVNSMTVIAEYQASSTDPNLAEAATERIVMKFNRPQANHNGGQLEFGPDGMLYIGSGDGGSSNDNNAGHTGGSGSRPTNNLGNSQDKTRLLGKILRIDPLGNNGPGGQYGIPAGNPFIGAGGGVREEIFAYGLRNPWRFSFDTALGNRLFCADVGQGSVEEVNIITSGGNYGWHVKEGNQNFFPSAPVNGTTPVAPIAEYAHPGVTIGSPALPQIGISVAGGFVYRGSAIPALQGKYVFGDYSTTGGATSGAPNGILLGLEESAPLSGAFTLSTLNLVGGNPFAARVYVFGRDEAGEIYVSTKTTPGPVVDDATTGKPAGAISKIVAATTASVVLDASRDNSIFEEQPSNASGKGVSLFSGMTAGGNPRRALVAFDLSAVPAGAGISSAQLQLNISFGQGSNTPMALHRITQAWGEGNSNSGQTGGTGTAAQSGDATWSHRLYNTNAWTSPGGDFVASASATTNVGTSGSFTWSGTQITADVQGWQANTATNHGWILRGDETGFTNAKRVRSREDTTPSFRPKLTVSYAAAPPLTHRETWLNTYYAVGQFVDDDGDDDNDRIPNQAEYAYGFSPLVANAPTDGLTVTATLDGAGGTDFTITLRRDPLATDLTYRIQTSADLANWSTIAQSIGGATASGSGFVSDNAIAGQSPFRLVTARQNVPAASPQHRHARLEIVRTP